MPDPRPVIYQSLADEAYKELARRTAKAAAEAMEAFLAVAPEARTEIDQDDGCEDLLFVININRIDKESGEYEYATQKLHVYLGDVACRILSDMHELYERRSPIVKEETQETEFSLLFAIVGAFEDQDAERMIECQRRLRAFGWKLERL